MRGLFTRRNHETGSTSIGQACRMAVPRLAGQQEDAVEVSQTMSRLGPFVALLHSQFCVRRAGKQKNQS